MYLINQLMCPSMILTIGTTITLLKSTQLLGNYCLSRRFSLDNSIAIAIILSTNIKWIYRCEVGFAYILCLIIEAIRGVPKKELIFEFKSMLKRIYSFVEICLRAEISLDIFSMSLVLF